MYQRDMDVSKFFDLLLPCFINILKNGKPSFVSTSPDNVSRQQQLEEDGRASWTSPELPQEVQQLGEALFGTRSPGAASK